MWFFLFIRKQYRYNIIKFLIYANFLAPFLLIIFIVVVIYLYKNLLVMEIFYDEFILNNLPNAYYNEIVKHINQLSKSYNVNDFDVNDFNSYNECIKPYSFTLSLDNINICLIECEFCVIANMIEDEKLNVKYIDSINIDYCNITGIEYMSCDDYQNIITNSLPKNNPITE